MHFLQKFQSLSSDELDIQQSQTFKKDCKFDLFWKKRQKQINLQLYYINYHILFTNQYKVNLNIIRERMYGKLNQRKLNENDYIMSCEKARQQLSEYMNEEAKRVNVDSAKKLAVVQHMDYDGFRQMVLGANIFPTKSKELYTFTKGEPQIIASTLIKQEQQKGNQRVIKKTQQAIVLQKIQGKSEMHCNNFRQFKKKFNDNYQSEFNQGKALQCYNLLKQQNEERLSKIFNTECEANILVKIVTVLQQIIKAMQESKAEGLQQQAGFMLIFFKTILRIPTMKSMSLIILSKKQKQVIANFVDTLKQVLTSQYQIQQIQEVAKSFKK